MLEHISTILAGVGTLFFIAGVAGLLRFPDVYSRLHALTKADNLGLGFIVLSLALRTGSLTLILKLVLIWAFVIFASATSCYLVAKAALQMKMKPVTSPGQKGGEE